MSNYRFNPACLCDWCRNDGQVPTGTADNGHAFGYAQPHIPPDSGPWESVNRPRIIALLSFYDEDPDWLERCILSLELLQCDRLIALHGAYSLYPGASPKCSPDELRAVAVAANVAGVKCTSILPAKVWDSEIEKRNFLFELAEQEARPQDWYFVVDADEFVTHAPRDLRERLNATPFDVAAVELKEPGHPLGTMVYPTHPKFFRAIPGLRAVKDHFTYTTPDGRKLWGNAKTQHLEPRADLSTVKVEHHNQLRHPDRRRAAMQYYETRDRLGVEELPENRSILADAA
jgi:hypothetical protein